MTLGKTLLAGAAVAMLLPMAASAADTPRSEIRDRVENRLDRIESRRDERVDHGPRDVIEDRIDRWEDRRDYADKPVPRKVNRWERRSWRWRLGHRSGE